MSYGISLGTRPETQLPSDNYLQSLAGEEGEDLLRQLKKKHQCRLHGMIAWCSIDGEEPKALQPAKVLAEVEVALKALTGDMQRIQVIMTELEHLRQNLEAAKAAGAKTVELALG